MQMHAHFPCIRQIWDMERQERCVRAKSTANDRNTSPWREASLKRGQRDPEYSAGHLDLDQIELERTFVIIHEHASPPNNDQYKYKWGPSTFKNSWEDPWFLNKQLIRLILLIWLVRLWRRRVERIKITFPRPSIARRPAAPERRIETTEACKGSRKKETSEKSKESY